jgi:hypothetical protein
MKFNLLDVGVVIMLSALTGLLLVVLIAGYIISDEKNVVLEQLAESQQREAEAVERSQECERVVVVLRVVEAELRDTVYYVAGAIQTPLSFDQRAADTALDHLRVANSLDTEGCSG